MKQRKSQPYIIIMYLAGLIIIGIMYTVLGKPLSMIYNTTYNDSNIYPINCYQEFSNKSSPGESPDCKMNYDGSYGFLGTWTNEKNSVDGDFSTTSTVTGNNDGLIFVSYTMPHYNVVGANWTVKDGSDASPYMISIPIKCVYQKPQMRLLIILDNSANTVNYYCHNGVTYQALSSKSTPTLNFYEEGVNWLDDSTDKEIYQTFFTRSATIWQWILLFVALAMTLWFILKAQERGPSDY